MVGPALLLLCLLSPVAPASPAPDDAAALRAQARAILESGEYQQSLPDPGEDEKEPELLDHESTPGISISPAVVLIVIGAVLLVLIVLGMQRHEATVESRRAPGAPVQSRLDLGAPLPLADFDADALAAEGRFADAIHVLLLRALRDVARAGGEFARGITSREVVFRVDDPAARAALAELVAAVERHEFGARALGAEDFSRCRAAWELVQGRLRPAARRAA
jgi:hypothetical protein